MQHLWSAKALEKYCRWELKGFLQLRKEPLMSTMYMCAHTHSEEVLLCCDIVSKKSLAKIFFRNPNM